MLSRGKRNCRGNECFKCPQISMKYGSHRDHAAAILAERLTRLSAASF